MQPTFIAPQQTVVIPQSAYQISSKLRVGRPTTDQSVLVPICSARLVRLSGGIRVGVQSSDEQPVD
jgi:hypothetical protein